MQAHILVLSLSNIHTWEALREYSWGWWQQNWLHCCRFGHAMGVGGWEKIWNQRSYILPIAATMFALLCNSPKLIDDGIINSDGKNIILYCPYLCHSINSRKPHWLMKHVNYLTFYLFKSPHKRKLFLLFFLTASLFLLICSLNPWDNTTDYLSHPLQPATEFWI